jgi:diacylglycerol kinase family enzyme
MTPRRQVRLFFNHRSGPGGVSAGTVCGIFASYDCECQVSLLNRKTDLRALAQQDAPATAWVAAGGDGTVNTLANALAGTGRPMGVLPIGTLNHFARDLNLSLSLAEAIEILVSAPVRKVDAAEVNGRIFVNNSSLGVYPAMVIDRERMKNSGWNKWSSLVVASARAFLRFRCLEVDLELDGEQRRCNTPLLLVGNNRYVLEGGRIGRRERLDAGHLALYLMPQATRASMLRLFAAALVGKAHSAPELEEFFVTEFTVKARTRRLRVSLDGEVRRMPPPLRYAIQPGALHVLCPHPDLPVNENPA